MVYASPATVQDLWSQHVRWSQTANRLKAGRNFWRTVVLILTSAGAALQTLAATLPEPQWLARTVGGLGVLALVAAPILGRYRLTPDATRNWLRCRSVSEGIKSEIYTFLAKAAPYGTDDATAQLVTRVKKAREWGKDLLAEVDRTPVKDPDPFPQFYSGTGYIDWRAREQINGYYRKKAGENKKLAERFRTAELCLTLIAAAVGALASWFDKSLGPTLGAWVAVITTISSGIVAHAAAGRFDFQATMYAATAQQLEDLILTWESQTQPRTPEAWSAFVNACEGVISAENRAWMAKLEREDTPPSGNPAQPAGDNPPSG